MTKPKVKFENITKKYDLYTKQSDKVVDLFLSKNKRGKKKRSFYALKDVSFTVNDGEVIGIIGINGSGKSTLSNLLAEVVPPTSGKTEINGETSLIAIAVGLNNHLSGLENIELKCLMHGLSKEEINEIRSDIIDFADIGHFINQPVKNYSSGMKSRLGFAISAFTNPDILVVDEALSVGDQTFYNKCIEKFNEYKASGKTIFFITHSLSQVRSLCDRVMWLHHGELKEFGQTEEVLDRYEAFIKWFNVLSEAEKKQYKQDMLSQQSHTTRIEERYKSPKKPKNTSAFLQIGALLIAAVLSGIFMFIDKAPLAFFDGTETRISDLVEVEGPNEEVSDGAPTFNEVLAINNSGNIKVLTADIFQDKELLTSLDSVNFATPLFVEEQIGDVYKVEFNNITGYTPVENVDISQEQVRQSDFEVLNLYPILPEGYAFEYFLSHLRFEYTSIKDKFQGSLNEGVDEIGRKFLEFENDNVTYLFDENELAVTIIIKNINANSASIRQFLELATVHSDDKQLFFVPINDYNITFNLVKETVTLDYLYRETN